MDINNKILNIVSKNSDLLPWQIAQMIGIDEKDVANAIDEMNQQGIIVGRHTLINWDKAGVDVVTAFIELKVTPQYGEGFDRIASRIYQYDHVKSVFLMSGSFDIAVIIEGTSMKEVALFVAEKLSPMEFVVSTSTHFVLRKYKDNGLVFDNQNSDDRQIIS